ncbi:MAG: hypothetical protein MHM6MM_002810 [Cercozoa sp. M6MM]
MEDDRDRAGTTVAPSQHRNLPLLASNVQLLSLEEARKRHGLAPQQTEALTNGPNTPSPNNENDVLVNVNDDKDEDEVESEPGRETVESHAAAIEVHTKTYDTGCMSILLVISVALNIVTALLLILWVRDLLHTTNELQLRVDTLSSTQHDAVIDSVSKLDVKTQDSLHDVVKKLNDAWGTVQTSVNKANRNINALSRSVDSVHAMQKTLPVAPAFGPAVSPIPQVSPVEEEMPVETGLGQSRTAAEIPNIDVVPPVVDEKEPKKTKIVEPDVPLLTPLAGSTDDFLHDDTLEAGPGEPQDEEEELEVDDLPDPVTELPPTATDVDIVAEAPHVPVVDTSNPMPQDYLEDEENPGEEVHEEDETDEEGEADDEEEEHVPDSVADDGDPQLDDSDGEDGGDADISLPLQ